MNKPNKNKHADKENKIVVTRGGGVGERAKWVKGINGLVKDGN